MDVAGGLLLLVLPGDAVTPSVERAPLLYRANVASTEFSNSCIFSRLDDGVLNGNQKKMNLDDMHAQGICNTVIFQETVKILATNATPLLPQQCNGIITIEATHIISVKTMLFVTAF